MREKEFEGNEKCMTPGCSKKKMWNGLCRSCWSQAKSLIEKEETTWEKLIEMGLATPKMTPFKEIFYKLKKQDTPPKKKPNEN